MSDVPCADADRPVRTDRLQQEAIVETVAVVTDAGTIVDVVPGALVARGVRPTVHDDLAAWLHPDDAARARQLLEGAGCDVQSLGERMSAAGGGWVPVEMALADHRGTAPFDGWVVTLREANGRDDGHAPFHDRLTGVASRDLFRDHLDLDVARSRRESTSTALLVLDIDGFAGVNDHHGHAVGDALLRAVGTRLRAVVRDADTVGRLGDDDFGIAVPQVRDVAHARSVAMRAQQAVQAPLTVAGTTIEVTTSVGVAILPGGSTTSSGASADLLRDAGAAMAEARRLGGGQVVVFDEDLGARQHHRRELERALTEAVREDQLLLHYQPIVNLEDGSITGVEALVRWQHPSMGLIPPADFIPLAESTGMIVPIGAWVLREAARQAVEWQRRFPSEDGLQVAVNVSAIQLTRGDIEADVRAALATSGINPRNLTLEVTESTLVHDTDYVRSVLLRLKALGVRLAVDDFGTGYSSLQYLHHLPVDILKIDRSFIVDLARGGRSGALVEAIVAMGHTLNLRTVAEGIEDMAQLEAARIMACDSGQGYLFARPGRGVEIEALLAARARAGRYFQDVVAS